MNTESKKKEWKWPLGIFLMYMTFVTATLVFVVFTFTQRTDLVVENYYEKTLTYQDHIDRAQNALNLKVPFRVERRESYVDLIFPPDLVELGISGEVVFYRPSDSLLDKTFPLDTDREGHQMIPLAELQPGMWKVQVTWNSGGTEYFSESNLFIRQ